MTINTLKDILKEDDKQLIYNAILENKNPNKLHEELTNKLNKKISYYLIKEYILQEFKKEWKKKKWQDVKGTECSPITTPSESRDENNDIITNNNPPDDLPSIGVNTNILNQNNYLETILKKLYQLESQNKEIKKMITELSLRIESVNKNYKENFADFVNIYSSDYVKTTFNLNKTIKDELQKQIGNPRGIKKNDSKLINTALLIALINEKQNNK